ncbi:MAG: insulinase family protein, partial [Melioribacteraceae bacterium]|nr:insulinase family protein [Melioribacteraceae bacterium]
YSTFVTKKSVDLPKGLAYQRGFVKIDQPQRIEETGGGEQSHLFYGYIKDYGNNEKPALQALALLLKDEIVFDIREKQGMAYRMSAGIDLVKDKALFFIKLPTLPKNVDPLTPQFPGFFTPDFAEKIDENSLAKSVNMYLGRMMFRRLSSINQAYYLAYSYYFYGNINEDRESLEKLKNVTVDEVRQVTEKYLNVENPIEVIVR